MIGSYLNIYEYKELMSMLSIITEKVKNKPLECKKLLLEEFLNQYKKSNHIVESVGYHYYIYLQKFLVSVKFKNISHIAEIEFKL